MEFWEVVGAVLLALAIWRFWQWDVAKVNREEMEMQRREDEKKKK